MRSFIHAGVGLCVFGLWIGVPYAYAADAPEVAAARKKMDAKISVNFKDTPFKEVLDEFGKQTELKFFRDVGIPGNKSISYSCTDKNAKDAIQEILKPNGWGFVVHIGKDKNDRNHGWIKIVSGEAEFVEAKPMDPPKDPKDPPKDPKDPPKDPKDPPKDPKDPPVDGDAAEKAASAQLKLAKMFIEDRQYEDAREYLQKIVKKYPTTKAASEANTLLEAIRNKK